MRLMIVDDDEDMRDVLEVVLGHGGFGDIVAASSGAEALKLLGVGENSDAAGEIDTIVLDITMPGIDGIEVCARIRQDARYQETPIIMVTALKDMASLSQAFLAGANDYVRKPFDKTELLARVRNALKLKGELDRRRKREEALSAMIEGARATESQSLLDPATGLLTRAALEGMMRDRASRAGCVAVLQVDAWQPYVDQYGSEAAEVLHRRVAEALAHIPASLGAMLASLEPGLFALFTPEANVKEVDRLLQRAREAVLKLRERHRDSAASAFVTVSGGFAEHDPEQPGRAFEAAMAAATTASQGGGDQIMRAN